jgi:hypothetical protein
VCVVGRKGVLKEAARLTQEGPEIASGSIVGLQDRLGWSQLTETYLQDFKGHKFMHINYINSFLFFLGSWGLNSELCAC